MAACQLFFAGVAVVDGDEKSALDVSGDAVIYILRGERGLDAFVGFGMDRVAVEEFEFFGEAATQVSTKRPFRVSMRREPCELRISTGRASKNSLAKDDGVGVFAGTNNRRLQGSLPGVEVAALECLTRFARATRRGFDQDVT